MKKLLVSVFALATALTMGMSQSFAACGCGCSAPIMQAPCGCAAPIVGTYWTGYAAPMDPCCCQQNTCCQQNSCCCKKRGYWYNLFHTTYKCGCGCDNMNCVPKCNSCCD